MGNIIMKKEFDKKASTKSNEVAALSNVSGVAPPPKFSSKVDLQRNANNFFGSMISRKSQIDTFPRNTGGSFELFKTIESNQKNAKINLDSDVDSIDLLRERFKENGKKSENVDKTKSSAVVIENKKSTNTRKNDEKYKYRYDSSSSTDSLNNLKITESRIASQNKKIENKLAIETKKTVEKLNKTRDRVYSNLASLSEIEDKQRSKILEQQRQLHIQNMKLKDALIIHKSLSNFNQLSEDYETFNENSHYAKHNQFKANTFIRKPKYNRQRIPLSSVQFPTYLPKYDPPIERMYSRHPNMSYYRPDKNTNDDKVGLYLEKTEDIVDSNGRILSSNQSFKYLGEADAKTASTIEQNTVTETSKPDVKIYDKHSYMKMNNHKYEVIKNESTSTLTKAELEDVIKIIEQTEKYENKGSSTYFVNGNLIKRTAVEQIEKSKNKDPPKKSSPKYDDLRPSFTVSEKLYKMYLNKKDEKQNLEMKNFNTVSKAGGLYEKKEQDKLKYYGQDFQNAINVQALKEHFKNFKSSKELDLNTKL